MKRWQTLSDETMERVDRYARAHRLHPDAVIEAALTIVVPQEIEQTAALGIPLELGIRARQINDRMLLPTGGGDRKE